MKECIDCGADGFRFDAAKHIETPADNPAFASNFWDVVLDGARDYYKQVNHYDGVYFYGEVLNRIDDANAEAYYRSKMSLTDNSTSDNIRNSVKYKSASGAAQGGYCGYIAGEGDKAVLWAESHDTYMGGGSSYDVNDSDIKRLGLWLLQERIQQHFSLLVHIIQSIFLKMTLQVMSQDKLMKKFWLRLTKLK